MLLIIMKKVQALLSKTIESMQGQKKIADKKRLHLAEMSRHQHLVLKASSGSYGVIHIHHIERIEDFEAQFTADLQEMSHSGKSLKISIELYIDNDYKTKSVSQFFWAAVPLRGYDDAYADSAEQFIEKFWSLVQNPPPGITFITTDLQ